MEPGVAAAFVEATTGRAHGSERSMHAVYLACFFGGLAATVVFAALGALGSVAGHGVGHLHAGHGHAGHPLPTHGHPVPSHSAHGHTATSGSTSTHVSASNQAPAVPGWLTITFGWTLSWFSPLTLAAGALCFGGAGLVAEGLLPAGTAVAAVLIAVLAAMAGAVVVRTLMGAMIRASTRPLRADAVGALGTINAAIRADAVGEVIYTLEGLSRSAPARSVGGTPLPRGTAVVIVRRERGIVWVEPIDPLAALAQEPSAVSHQPSASADDSGRPKGTGPGG